MSSIVADKYPAEIKPKYCLCVSLLCPFSVLSELIESIFQLVSLFESKIAKEFKFVLKPVAINNSSVKLMNHFSLIMCFDNFHSEYSDWQLYLQKHHNPFYLLILVVFTFWIVKMSPRSSVKCSVLN